MIFLSGNVVLENGAPPHPQYFLVLAGVFAMKQDSVSSVRELKNYLRLAPNSPNAGLVREQIRRME
jgi:hypothetical protein